MIRTDLYGRTAHDVRREADETVARARADFEEAAELARSGGTRPTPQWVPGMPGSGTQDSAAAMEEARAWLEHAAGLYEVARGIEDGTWPVVEHASESDLAQYRRKRLGQGAAV